MEWVKIVESWVRDTFFEGPGGGLGGCAAESVQGGLSLVRCSSGIEPLEAEVPARPEVFGAWGQTGRVEE